MYRPLVIWGFFSIVNLIAACHPCGPLSDRKYKIDHFNISTWQASTGTMLIDDDLIKYYDLVFEVYWELISKKEFNRNSFAMNSLLACWLPPPQILDSVMSIKITCDNSYLSKEAGEDLSSYFGILDYYGSPYPLDDLQSSLEFWGTRFVLLEAPEVETQLSFELTFFLEDGRELTVETPRISILP